VHRRPAGVRQRHRTRFVRRAAGETRVRIRVRRADSRPRRPAGLFARSQVCSTRQIQNKTKPATPRFRPQRARTDSASERRRHALPAVGQGRVRHTRRPANRAQHRRVRGRVVRSLGIFRHGGTVGPRKRSGC